MGAVAGGLVNGIGIRMVVERDNMRGSLFTFATFN